jgi:hypothetical protein
MIVIWTTNGQQNGTGKGMIALTGWEGAGGGGGAGADLLFHGQSGYHKFIRILLPSGMWRHDTWHQIVIFMGN